MSKLNNYFLLIDFRSFLFMLNLEDSRESRNVLVHIKNIFTFFKNI